MEFLDRNMADTILYAMRFARVVGLLGPRQAGKSTLVRKLAEEQLSAEYISLDEEPARSLAAADPAGFLAARGSCTVIDEIQRVPELMLAIKARVDRDPTPGQLLITGSANLRRVPTVSDALPGRVDYLTLWPLTQGEIAGWRDEFLARMFAGEPPVLADAPLGRHEYASTLLAGGFPEARSRPETARSLFFSSYVESIVERDVPDVSRVREPSAIATLLRLVAARSSGLARYDSLAREVGVDGKTVKAHLDVLERLFLIRVRRSWHVNLGKRQVKASKLYVSDSGLLGALVGADAGRVRDDSGFAGSLFETFVVTELERQASWFGEPLTFWHYREDGHEVDAIVERPSGEIVGIEVKASATVRPRDFAGLRRLRERVGERMRCGAVLYAGARTIQVADGMWALPLQALWAA